MKKTIVATILLQGLLCSGAFPAADDAPAAAPSAKPIAGESAAALRREFEGICQQLNAGRNGYYGTAQIRELERYAATPTDDPRARAMVRARLGAEMLRVGDSAAAVRWLTEAREIAEQQLDPTIRADLLRVLGLAHLRLGEQSNCVAMHGPASCILPLAREGIHTDRTGSLAAIETYKEYLAQRPGDARVEWLLNVAAMTVGRYPQAVPEGSRVPQSALTSSYDIKYFRDVASDVGLDINQSCGGGIMDDFDGDGLLDVVSSSSDPCSRLNFYRNDGQGGFEDRSEVSQLAFQLGGINVIHADYDNDGDLDLLLLRGGWLAGDGQIRNSLLRNDGHGRFEDVTRAAGLAKPAYPTQAGAWADYDNDGDLDLYIGNEVSHDSQPFPSQLFRNNGDGTFTDVAHAAGVTNGRMVKGVAWGDYDDDGDPDLYVSNIGPNRLYRNDGDGSFTDVAPQLGTTGPDRRSFPTWFFDYDNDGKLDLFVADYTSGLKEVAEGLLGRTRGVGYPRIYHNLGGRFEEVGRELGLDQPSLPMGVNFGDLDNDGFSDFYLGTGAPSYESIAPNLMYRNDGGKRFQNVTYSGGFGHLQKGHGVAFGDVDNDGDQDIFEQMGGIYPGDAFPSVLYENPGHGNHWVTLRLIGETSNRSAIGARIRVTIDEGSGPRQVTALVGSGGSFGGSSLQQEIGLGSADRITELEITWPTTGKRQRFTDLDVDRVYEIREDAKRPRVVETTPIRLGAKPARTSR